MPVRFILGRAGSGKTHCCLAQIEALVRQEPMGKPIYWLLPKQATFQAERELTCRLQAFTRIRVVSFDQLGKDILTDCGDVGIPQITPLGRRMVVGHLLRTRQDQLHFYRASARRPGLAAELDSTFGEFERAGLDAMSLDDFLHRMEPQDHTPSNLREKLHDVSLLMNAYNAYIGQDRLDPQRRLELILKRVNDCSLLKQAVLFVNDFHDFTGYEQKLLVAVAGTCQSAQIALLVDPDSSVVTNPHLLPDDLSLFHRTERAYRSLYFALTESGIRIDPPLLLRENFRAGDTALKSLEKHFFASTAEVLPVSASGDVKSLELQIAPDARIEVDAVARRIRAALAKGFRLRDIAVLVRDLGDYQELIDASFREHDLPYFADHRRTAAHHPLLQFIRACLVIAKNGWPHDAVMTLLKTDLAGVSEQEADELENYVLRHRIRGRMWESKAPWDFRRDITRTDEDGELSSTLTDAGSIDEIRKRVVEKLQPFIAAVSAGKSLPAKSIVAHLFTVLETFNIRHTLSRWMSEAEQAGHIEQRNEHEQVWSEVVVLFEDMADLIGDEVLTLTDFLEVLDSGLESFDLAFAPPTVDQILVGQIDRTRTPDVKLVIVMGLNEGQFPRLHREDCVLSDSERRTLRNRKIDLDPETERRLLDERFLAYIALTQPSSQLVVTRCLADDNGRPHNASPFWIELLRLFPDVPVQQIARPSQADPAGIGTPRQLVTSLMRWVRAAAPPSPPVWPALYQWLASHTCCDDALDVMRYRAWSALGYANSAGITPETAAMLFPVPLQSTVARLETLAVCPFRHFIKYGLNLQERDDADVTGIDLSNAYHHVLENLIKDILESRQDWCEIESSVKAAMIRTHAAEIGRTLRNELMLSTARNRYLLERIEKTLEAAVEAQCEMHRRGKYRPAFAGLKFGGKKSQLPAYRVSTPAGHDVRLRGNIDRVDLYDQGNTFTVSDYKLATDPLALDRVYHGLSLQLLAYLLIVQSGSEQLVGRKLTPAAAFFLQLLRSHQSVDHPSEAKAPDHPDFHLSLKPRGIMDARAIHSLDSNVSEGASPVVAFHIKKDGQLGYRNVSDVADEAEFTAILQHVEKRLGELADQMIAGDIRIEPYWINRSTPCSQCGYRSICRFEPGVNKYNMLPAMKREDVLQRVTIGGADAR